jgi:hypothetical protein
VLGGYYGSGGGGGTVTQFLMGVRDASATATVPPRFLAICRVGTGYSGKVDCAQYQYCGSGSVCFWAYWIRIHYSEVRIRLRILLQYHQAKIVSKTLIPTVL